MVEAKTKTTARARIAHKLAKYVRATPIQYASLRGANAPSTSHLSKFQLKQLWEEPQKEDSEIKIVPGIQLTIKEKDLSENQMPQDPQLVENLFNPDQS